ncbi:hypothetical protein RHMOL_Rhmol10G0254400 [Rhododendron molle]|uniref:Uncharacterized protein n=1 Tax=Rhododendron molle TaxID=49168 RepID=A0ACC0M5T6_RHOML|nr:hypothetical protein RHMOL_Rhmol10G0254400 [Rhododendron molle]
MGGANENYTDGVPNFSLLQNTRKYPNFSNSILPLKPTPIPIWVLVFGRVMADFLPLVRRSYLTFYNWTVFIGWQVSSAISCFENFEGLRPRICLPRCRKASSSCSIRSHIGGPYSILHGLVGEDSFLTRTHLLVSLLVISWSITEIRKSNEKLTSDPYPICSQGQSDPGAINQSSISGTTPMEMGLWVGESGLGPLGFSNICRSIQVFCSIMPTRMPLGLGMEEPLILGSVIRLVKFCRSSGILSLAQTRLLALRLPGSCGLGIRKIFDTDA